MRRFFFHVGKIHYLWVFFTLCCQPCIVLTRCRNEKSCWTLDLEIKVIMLRLFRACNNFFLKRTLVSFEMNHNMINCFLLPLQFSLVNKRQKFEDFLPRFKNNFTCEDRCFFITSWAVVLLFLWVLSRIGIVNMD